MKLEIIYEDNHIIAANKPAGLLVQGDETGDPILSDFVKDYIKDRYNKPGAVFLGTIHRIDRPVSGVVLFARTSKALERMNKLFAEQKVKKRYFAIVKNMPEPLEATLVDYIYKDTTKNIARALDFISKKHPDAKRSELKYNLHASLENEHLLEVLPATGRPHQIRVQLSKIGCPIIGDLKYGYKNANFDASIALHCKSMSFTHPITLETVTIDAEVPNNEIWRRFKQVD
jgi:23S rRNA pseudouridine1911/1915/1917 synthase